MIIIINDSVTFHTHMTRLTYFNILFYVTYSMLPVTCYYLIGLGTSSTYLLKFADVLSIYYWEKTYVLSFDLNITV